MVVYSSTSLRLVGFSFLWSNDYAVHGFTQLSPRKSAAHRAIGTRRSSFTAQLAVLSRPSSTCLQVAKDTSLASGQVVSSPSANPKFCNDTIGTSPTTSGPLAKRRYSRYFSGGVEDLKCDDHGHDESSQKDLGMFLLDERIRGRDNVEKAEDQFRFQELREAPSLCEKDLSAVQVHSARSSELGKAVRPVPQEPPSAAPVAAAPPSTTGAAVESAASESEMTQQEQRDREILIARLLLIGAAALYGTNFSLVKLMGETDLPVGLSTTLRFGLAALATSPWLFARSAVANDEDATEAAAAYEQMPQEDAATETTTKAMSPAWGAAIGGFEVGMWNSIGYVSQAVGLETTLASKSAFLCSLAVVVVPFLDWLSGRHLKAREWAGAALALGGVAMLELGGDAASSGLFSSWNYGDTASMLQPFAFGMGFWRMEYTMQKYPNEANRCTAAQLLAAVLGSALYCVVFEGDATWDWAQLQAWLTDPTLLAFIAWTGIASTALSVYMETIALKTLSAAETTLLLSTEPIWGAVFAAMIIGEQFGVDAAVGGFLVLAGCLYSNLGLSGLKSLLSGKPAESSGEDGDQINVVQERSVPANEDRQQQVALGASAATLAAAGIGAWNSISIGARVAVLQVSDLLEDLF